jgi:hypothetical protein
MRVADPLGSTIPLGRGVIDRVQSRFSKPAMLSVPIIILRA